MRFKLIDQILAATLLSGLVALTCGLFSNLFLEGLALFCGSAWGALHLLFLKFFFHRLLIDKQWDSKLILLSFLKWPLLYLVGFGLLKTHFLAPLYLLAGFSLLFAAIFFVALKEKLIYAK